MDSIVSVLMAGGYGTRLWPWSLKERPKQFLPLLGQRSLVRTTADRLLPLSTSERMLVLTNSHLLDEAHAQLSDLPLENLLGEPRSCNTAPCVALAAALCERRWGGEAVMVVVAADHFIADEEAFRKLVLKAGEIASSEDCLVTLGIPPTRPETGYGYLECDRPFREIPPGESVRLVAFREKPNAETAAEYLAGGRHLWNMGNFVWRCEVILREFDTHLPELSARARSAVRESEAGDREALDRFYLDLPDDLCDSVDFGIMEKAAHIEALPCPIPWDDVGSWAVLPRLRAGEMDPDGNLSLIRHLPIDSRNILVAGEEISEGVVVTVGVENLIVIRSGGRVLIASREGIDRMREVTEGLKNRGWDHLL